MKLLNKAIQFATKVHEGQMRKWTAEPYIYHPMRVAGMYSLYYGMEEDGLCGAWLHDVVEDCGITTKELSDQFGPIVESIVRGLTAPTHIDPELNRLPRSERKKIDREFLSKQPKIVQTIKVFDRVDNLKSSHNGPRKFMMEKFIPESHELVQSLDKVDLKIKQLFQGEVNKLDNYFQDLPERYWRK